MNSEWDCRYCIRWFWFKYFITRLIKLSFY
jgi:hypothetical protein